MVCKQDFISSDGKSSPKHVIMEETILDSQGPSKSRIESEYATTAFRRLVVAVVAFVIFIVSGYVMVKYPDDYLVSIPMVVSFLVATAYFVASWTASIRSFRSKELKKGKRIVAFTVSSVYILLVIISFIFNKLGIT